jgi:hypothetical protein
VGGCAGACRDSLAKIHLLTLAFIGYAVWPQVHLSEVEDSIKPLPSARSGSVDINQLYLTREIRVFVSPDDASWLSMTMNTSKLF